MPLDIAIGLGLELTGKRTAVLADGSVRDRLAFAGRVSLLDEIREVEILLTDHAEAIVGTALLDDCRLTIDFARGTVDLKKSKKSTAKR